MWVLLKDFLLVSMGMGIGVVLMCILNVGKEADYEMEQLKESEIGYLLKKSAGHCFLAISRR